MESYNIFYSIYMCFIIVFGTGANLVLLVVYANHHEKYSSLLFLFALALVNCVSSLVVVPIIIFDFFFQVLVNMLDCKVAWFFISFSNSIAIFLIILISFERLRNICLSLKKSYFLFEIYNDKLALLVALLAAFVISVFSSAFYQMESEGCKNADRVYIYLSMTLLILVFIFLCTANVKIYLIVARSCRKVSNFQISISSDVLYYPNPKHNLDLKMTRKNLTLRKDWKIARRFLLITIIYIITWIPWLVVELCNDLRQRKEYEIFRNFYFLNNITDPVIYAFMSRYFRNDLLALFRSIINKCKCNHQS